MSDKKTFFVVTNTRSKWTYPMSYSVCFSNCQYNTPTEVAKFLPKQWGDLDSCRMAAQNLCDLLNGEIEVVPHDVHKDWEPNANFFRPTK